MSRGLKKAINNGRLDLVQEQLDKGKDPNGRLGYFRQKTPLCFALSKRHSKIVALLLQRGANPDARCKQIEYKEGPTNTLRYGGYTPLLYAVYKMDHECARVLLKGGADPNTQSWAHSKDVPLSRVCCSLYSLRERGGNPPHEKSCLDMIDLLLQHGADPNCSFEEDGGKSNEYLIFHSYKSVLEYCEIHELHDVVAMMKKK